jgi:hypothetical protein
MLEKGMSKTKRDFRKVEEGDVNCKRHDDRYTK